jgi:hypothetical protein
MNLGPNVGNGPVRILNRSWTKGIFKLNNSRKNRLVLRLNSLTVLQQSSIRTRSATLRAVHGGRGSTGVLVPTLGRGSESRSTSTTGKVWSLCLGVITSGLAACLSGLFDPDISHLLLLLLLLLLGHRGLRSSFGSNESRISSLPVGFITFREVVTD